MYVINILYVCVCRSQSYTAFYSKVKFDADPICQGRSKCVSNKRQLFS